AHRRPVLRPRLRHGRHRRRRPGPPRRPDQHPPRLPPLLLPAPARSADCLSPRHQPETESIKVKSLVHHRWARPKTKEPLLAERPLSIACHIKTYFFVVVSFLVVSAGAILLAESLILLVESVAILAVLSAGFAVESAALASAPELLHAAKAAIAATKKN